MVKYRSEFIRHILTLIGGSGFALLIPLIVAPLLTRLYTPAEYGILSLYVSTCAILSVVATGRYELAILLPKDPEDADRINILSSGLTFFTGITIFIIFVTILKPLINNYSHHFNINWFYPAPLTIISLGLYQSFSYRLNRDKDYKAIAESKIIKNAFTGAGQITFGYFNMGSWGLIAGKIIGELLSMGYLGKAVRKITLNFNIRKSVHRIKELARQYSNFPKFNSFHALTTAVSANLPILILTTFFGTSVAGLFGLSMRVCYAPVSILAVSIGQVFSQKISEIYNDTGDISSFTLKTLRSLVFIGFIPFLLLLILAPQIFAIVFGREWGTAGIFSQYLTAWYLLSFLVSPLIYIPMMLGEQKKAFIIELVSLTVRMSALMLGVYLKNEFISVLAYSIGGSFILLYMLYWIVKLAKSTQLALVETG